LAELTVLASGGNHDVGHSGAPEGAQTSPIMAAAAIREAGVESVVISLGADGLLADTPAGRWHARPPAVIAGNATGAGDAVVAALAHGLVSGRSWPGRLRHAVALGAATVASPVAGEFQPADYSAGLAAATVCELIPAPSPASDETQPHQPRLPPRNRRRADAPRRDG
jgi:fructose-1-phosphate kinase PfkB-like protein